MYIKLEFLSVGGLEYTESIPCIGEWTSTKKGALSMTLNCIWWWGYSSSDLECVDYPFIAIIPRFTQDHGGSTG